MFALSTVSTAAAQPRVSSPDQPNVPQPSAPAELPAAPAVSAAPEVTPAPAAPAPVSSVTEGPAAPAAAPAVGSIAPTPEERPNAAPLVVERDIAVTPDGTVLEREIEVVPVAEPATPAAPAVDVARADNVGAASESTGAWALKVGSYRARVSGYVQSQYQNFKQSENELSSDGLRLLNQKGVYIPRARVLLEGENDWSALVLEYDIANRSNSGSGVIRAEGTLHWRKNQDSLPYVELTAGMFRTPFGADVVRSARVRLWAELPTVFQAFWPGQSDTGVRVQGAVEWFRYAMAYVNGHPINEPRFGGLVPTRQGDFVGRLGADVTFGKFRFVGGASLLKGRGFIPGTPVTKDTIVVRDAGETGVVTANNIQLIPGKAATVSRTFSRWAAGADVELSGNPLKDWQLWLRGEFVYGVNLDRGIYIVDPIFTGFDLRGYGAAASFENLIYRLGLVGVRYDFYEPNPDKTSNVGGQVAKVAQGIQTISGLLGVQIPGTLTRVFGQYDHVSDHQALGTNGRPVDLKNDRFTLRLQVAL